MRKKLKRSVKIINAALLISTKICEALNLMKVVHPCSAACIEYIVNMDSQFKIMGLGHPKDMKPKINGWFT